jgi:hypothetical protein
MSTSIYDGTRYLYAEQLKSKRVELTIKRVVGGVEFCDLRGQKATGFDVEFVERDRVLGVTGITVRRQLCMATGTDDPEKMTGKKITLYPVKSVKSATGLAIRIAVPEHAA